MMLLNVTRGTRMAMNKDENSAWRDSTSKHQTASAPECQKPPRMHALPAYLIMDTIGGAPSSAVCKRCRIPLFNRVSIQL